MMGYTVSDIQWERLFATGVRIEHILTSVRPVKFRGGVDTELRQKWTEIRSI